MDYLFQELLHNKATNRKSIATKRVISNLDVTSTPLITEQEIISVLPTGEFSHWTNLHFSINGKQKRHLHLYILLLIPPLRKPELKQVLLHHKELSTSELPTVIYMPSTKLQEL